MIVVQLASYSQYYANYVDNSILPTLPPSTCSAAFVAFSTAWDHHVLPLLSPFPLKLIFNTLIWILSCLYY